jgi:hypothetical protein
MARLRKEIEMIETIKVKKKVMREVGGKMVDIGYHIINKSDFKPGVHEIYKTDAELKAEAKAEADEKAKAEAEAKAKEEAEAKAAAEAKSKLEKGGK